MLVKKLIDYYKYKNTHADSVFVMAVALATEIQYFRPHIFKRIVTYGLHSLLFYFKKDLRGGKTFSFLLLKIYSQIKSIRLDESAAQEV